MTNSLSEMTDPARGGLPSGPAAPPSPPPSLRSSSAHPPPTRLGAAHQSTITMEPLTKEQERFIDMMLTDSSDSETDCQVLRELPPRKKSVKQRLEEKEREIIAYQNMVITARAECSAMAHRARKAEEKLAAIGSEAARLYDTTCKVCYQRQINIIFTSCFHHFCCNICHRQLRDNKCPLCRKEITGTERVYWS